MWSRIARLAEHGTAFARAAAAARHGGWRCNPSRATNVRNVCMHGEALQIKALAKLHRGTKGEKRQEENTPAVCEWTLSRYVLPSVLLCVDVGLSSLIIPSPNTDE